MDDRVTLARRTLMRGAAALAVVGFDPVHRSWVTTAQADPTSAIPVPELDGELSLDPEDIAEAASDFGGLVRREPLAVLKPGSAEDVAVIVDYARALGVKVAPRGVSHSVFGQSQVDSGIAIDMKTLNRIDDIDHDGVWVDAGTRWRELIERTLEAGLAPRVLTDYIELTVGGVLSVGGVGGASYRNGLVVDNVRALEVVTGRGERVLCSPFWRRDLFAGVLGGLGQFAIITKAKIRLDSAKQSVRLYRLTYTDVERMMHDQRRIAIDRRFEYLEGQIHVPAPDTRVFVLEGAVYYTGSSPDDEALLHGLSPDSGSEPVIDDFSLFDFLNRLQVEFEQPLRAAGLWELPHPLFDMFLPSFGVEGFVAAQTANLQPERLGAGLGLIYPFRPARFGPTSMVYPRQPGLVWLFDLLPTPLPTGDPESYDELVRGQVEDNRVRFEQARDFGGKRYPISALEFSPSDWREHYGLAFAGVERRKQRYDPDNVLTPGQGLFASQA